MKKYILLIFAFLGFVCKVTSQEFVTTWKTINNSIQTLGINSNDLPKLSYYPNPVNSALTIISKTPIEQVTVYNLQG